MTNPSKPDTPKEPADHLHVRICLGRMANRITERLRDSDDAKEIRTMLRDILGDIQFLQKEQGYGGY